ncbi:pyridoxal-phosphate dependent enzyme [Kribbella qitaiheensis]|uniref:Pyridoxal-phosphate dependent enzyme n=1 Tax=Kribbella qitaiheensis TaxID=1544730 RepID=A0A7G6WXP5_9ACTN|nr:pyridoxal-phosphate dependent enzyme [Kribbella qitaiheensis]QNE18760.1 pyridoxal-phosphate dependent enzyme [Kribbella qitaiheensis]
MQVIGSTGNHGLGVSNALATLGGHGIVYVPQNASASKVAAIKRFGIEVRSVGTDSGANEVLARAEAAENGWTYISPYNDPDIVAGQGTIAVELLEQLDGRRLDAVFAAARIRRSELAGRRVAVVSCGGNISSKTLVAALT